jgi:group I intron endonuclease
MTCGIYRILNLANGKCYVGSSCNIEQRLSQHFRHLAKGTHHSILLQRAFLKYGRECFDVEILEECAKNETLAREQYYLDLYNSYNPSLGYNIAKDATASMRGTKASEETRKKMSASIKKAGYRPSEWHKEILRERMTNRVITDECRKNMSDSHKGSIPTNLEELRLFNIGRKHSEEQNKWQSNYNKANGIQPPPLALENTIKANQKTYPGVISSEGEIFYSITNMKKFCREHGLVSTRMFDLMKGTSQNKQHHGWMTLSEYYGELT